MEYGMPDFYIKIVGMNTCKVFRAKNGHIDIQNVFKHVTYSILLVILYIHYVTFAFFQGEI